MLTASGEALIDACTNAMRLAREERNPAHRMKQLFAAADLLDSEEARRLPPDHQQNLANLYAEALFLVTGGLVG